MLLAACKGPSQVCSEPSNAVTYDDVDQDGCKQVVRYDGYSETEAPWPKLSCASASCPATSRTFYEGNYAGTPTAYAPLADYACALELLKQGNGQIEFASQRRSADNVAVSLTRNVAVVDGPSGRVMLVQEIHTDVIDFTVDATATRWNQVEPIDPGLLDACLESPTPESASDCLFELTADLTCTASLDEALCSVCDAG